MDDEQLSLVREVQEALAKEPTATFKYKEVARAIEDIPQAISNIIRRNADRTCEILKSRHNVLPEIVDFSTVLSANTWETILHLCKDQMDHGLKIEFLASVPPLTRTILDALMTLVYLFDDPVERCRRYFVSGWGKGMVHYGRMQERYGTDPRWEKWLRAFHASTEGLLESVTPTDEEKADLKLAGYWPGPGKMAKACRDPKRKELLDLLNTMFYGQLSEDSHLAFPGLARRLAVLHKPVEGMPLFDKQRYRTVTFVTAQTLYVAYLSEVVGELGLSYQKERLRAVWAKMSLSPYWDNAIMLYEKRYEEWLR